MRFELVWHVVKLEEVYTYIVETPILNDNNPPSFSMLLWKNGNLYRTCFELSIVVPWKG